MQQPELWIGLVEVKPLDRKRYGAAGAFTNIVTWASDIEGFRQKAETIAVTLDMFVVDVEGAEPLAERMKACALTEEIEDLVLRAQSTPNAIVYFIDTHSTKPDFSAIARPHRKDTEQPLSRSGDFQLIPEGFSANSVSGSSARPLGRLRVGNPKDEVRRKCCNS